jgi:hypothetical protein
MVRERGLEPPHLSAQPPQGCVYTNFTTRACKRTAYSIRQKGKNFKLSTSVKP